MNSAGVYVAAQRAVLGNFFFFGVPIGMLIPRLAEIKEQVGADDLGFGSAIALGGLGGFLGNYLGAKFVHHNGSKPVAKFALLSLLVSNVANALAPNVSALALVAFFSGFSYAMANISINSQGVIIEQAIGRSFLPKGHAYWSIGAMTFGFISSFLAPYISPLTALLIAFTISFFGFLYFTKDLLPIEFDDRPHDDPSQLPSKEKIPISTFRFLIFIAAGQWLGTVAEFATGDWSAVLLHESFAISIGPNGYGYATFMLVLLVTRLTGPRLIDRFGLKEVVRTQGFIGGIGLIVFLQIANQTHTSNSTLTLIFACLAFGFTGLGVANMPAAFYSAAGRIPGLPSARALMVAGLITSVLSIGGRIGIASVSQNVGLVFALTATGFALLGAAVLSYVLDPARANAHAINR